MVVFAWLYLCRPRDNHGDAHGFFVEDIFSGIVVSSHADAMIGSKYNDGILKQSVAFEGFDDTSYLFVYSCDTGVIIAYVISEIVSHFGSFGGYVGAVGTEGFHIYILI